VLMPLLMLHNCALLGSTCMSTGCISASKGPGPGSIMHDSMCQWDCLLMASWAHADLHIADRET